MPHLYKKIRKIVVLCTCYMFATTKACNWVWKFCWYI